MTDYPSMNRLAELQQLIADFAKVERVAPMGDTGHRENDVEHSYGLALTCWYLQPKIAPNLDLLKIFQYALAHDIVEVHAGDTFVFDETNKATKDTREREALEQVRADWPDFPDLAAYAAGYMDKADDEARFVKAVDKILPVLLIELGLEHYNVWVERSVTLAHERDNKVSIHVSEYLSPYYEQLLAWLDERGNIPKV